jgi:AcrR family transcriptional regulator
MARAGLTAERLTTAALELADEIGYQNVTVSTVARRFGVKEASLYSHVRNVRDLRVRMALHALTELADRAATALAGRAGRDALVAFADAYRDYAHQHPGRYAATRIDLDDETAAASDGGRHSAMTRALLRDYDLPEPAETDAVRLLHSTFHGYVNLELAGGFRHHPRAAGDSWAAAVTALDVLLRNWPRDSSGELSI